ncbi:uncharacterized protein LOC113758662 [Coffea eugenioides]|uniref:uncharacterized protein LOC113757876 n=1 Tax=Coffea eugenioides TaxID=49369 RepID=UPI000F5C3A17|nr:uncharacterized protein LOC113711419 [Coffea arabica]XP_027090390.1 uncharacterized protein LOC113711421 [Coffea arabica]XP_027156756.1 uncharacterized protein LOC113757876 [Coffea eugenioides]XP_027157230.1 uncharacterized protein LOC113758662 [Coffea eugenioides]
MTDLLAHVVEHQGQNPAPEPGNPGNHIEGEDRALQRFSKFSPPKFLGGPDLDVAEWWLEKMIDIFTALHCTEERQVTFAVFQLEGAARSWLSKFASELIVTEQRRIRRIVQGLNVEIQKDLAVAQLSDFSDAVEKAQRVESTRLQVRTFQAKKRAILGSSMGQDDTSTPPKLGKGTGGLRFPGMSSDASQRGSSSASHGPCGYCAKPNHMEDVCWKKGRKCLRCGSSDHQIANYPGRSREGSKNRQSTKTNSNQSKGKGTGPKVSTRVYSLESHQAPDPSKDVEGTIRHLC